MKDNSNLTQLKDLCNDDRKSNRGGLLKSALLGLAIPASATLAMACYGVPMETETSCTNGIDEDGNGLVDCDDSVCSDTEVCRAGCFDGVDNNADGATDCDSWSCTGSEACLSITGCSDGEDNDENGLIDCDDPACAGSPDCP